MPIWTEDEYGPLLIGKVSAPLIAVSCCNTDTAVVSRRKTALLDIEKIDVEGTCRSLVTDAGINSGMCRGAYM